MTEEGIVESVIFLITAHLGGRSVGQGAYLSTALANNIGCAKVVYFGEVATCHSTHHSCVPLRGDKPNLRKAKGAK